MLAQKTAEVDALLRDNENLRAYIQDNMKQQGVKENPIWYLPTHAKIVFYLIKFYFDAPYKYNSYEVQCHNCVIKPKVHSDFVICLS